MPDTYRITIGSDEYEVEANSADEAQAKAQAAASNAAPSAGSTLSGVEGISELPDFQKQPLEFSQGLSCVVGTKGVVVESHRG